MHSFGATRGGLAGRLNGAPGNRGFGGYGFRGRGFGGCWGCGFGWGFGWGWGWPYWGLGWYDPWWEPYPYYGYPDGGDYEYGPPYAPPPESDYGDYDSYGPPYAPPESNDYSAAPSDQPRAPQPSSGAGPTTGNVTESMPTILLYLTDGTMYPATDYWVSGSMVHYVVAYGGESTVPIDQVDMQRTIEENAKRGVRFNLRPRSYTGVANADL